MERKSTRKDASQVEEKTLTDGGLPIVKPNKTVQKFLKVEFTEEQIKEFGSKLARTTTEIGELENEKKASSSNFKAQIDTKRATAESLSNKISNGFEYTNIECEVFMNVPNTGKKTIARKDNGETVEVLDMLQEELFVQTKMFPDTEDDGLEDDES